MPNRSEKSWLDHARTGGEAGNSARQSAMRAGPLHEGQAKGRTNQRVEYLRAAVATASFPVQFSEVRYLKEKTLVFT
jgi:hypothetical protein